MCDRLYKSSAAVAEMGDRLATIDMGRKLGGCASFSERVRDMLSPVRLWSVVCNVRAPYTQAVQIFGNISTALLCHRLTSTDNFTEIVPGEPLCRGS